MDDMSSDEDARRDEVLRRLLTTPKRQKEKQHARQKDHAADHNVKGTKDSNDDDGAN